MDTRTTPDDEQVYVDPEDAERASKGSFLAVYRTPDRERRWGWFCAYCESFDNAMDTMGRIRCNECGNLRKPTEWDAAHE